VCRTVWWWVLSKLP